MQSGEGGAHPAGVAVANGGAEGVDIEGASEVLRARPALSGYFIGNERKVQLEPHRVEMSLDALMQLRSEFKAHICDCSKNHATIELRLSSTEKDVAEIKGQLPHINQSLHRIKGKNDTLLGKVRI